MGTVAAARVALAASPADVVLLDHHLSDGLGADLAAEIAAGADDVLVVLISGDTTVVPPDGVELVAKPFRLADLLSLLGE